MAIAAKAGAAKAGATSNALRIASLNPDEMVQRGLPDGIIATITKARYTKWAYPNDPDTYRFFACFWLEPEAGSGFDPFVQPYSAGGIEMVDRDGNPTDRAAAFGTTLDGITMCDFSSETPEDWEGAYAVPLTDPEVDKNGQYQQIAKNTFWSFAIQCAKSSGFPEALLAPGDIRCFEGVRARFDRMLPPGKKSGIVAENTDETKRKSDGKVLVITEIVSMPSSGAKKAGSVASPKPAATTAPAATPASTPAAVATTDAPDDATLALLITAAIIERGGSAPKKDITAAVTSQFSGKIMATVFGRMGKPDFLENAEGFVYDADTAVFSLE